MITKIFRGVQGFAVVSFALSSILVAPLLANAQAIVQDLVNDAAVQVECTTITHNLVLGSRDKNTGGDVTELQVYLAQTNYLDADPTGYFGKLTKKAVQAFQSANNISPIGNVGPVTRAKVKELSCGSSSSASAQPVSNTVSGAVVPVATANNGVSNNQQSVAATSSSVVAPAASNSASDTQAPSIPTNLVLLTSQQ